MSDVTDDLDWDSVLGAVDAQEKEDEKERKEKPNGGFEALPAGPYEVVVQDANKQTSKAGNDMIQVQVKVTGGPYVNRTLYSYFVFSQGSPKGMRMTLERIAAFGLTRDYIAKNKPSISEIAELLVGLKATAIVAIQKDGEYKGNNEIKSFRPLDGAAPAAPAAPAAVESKPGVPNIPKPAPEAVAPTPSVPVPTVPGGDPAEDPFG